MRHDYKPPEHSFIDSMGRRHIRLDVDIMKCNGARYFTTFRYTAPVSFDFSQGVGGWWIAADYQTACSRNTQHSYTERTYASVSMMRK